MGIRFARCPLCVRRRRWYLANLTRMSVYGVLMLGVSANDRQRARAGYRGGGGGFYKYKIKCIFGCVMPVVRSSERGKFN